MDRNQAARAAKREPGNIPVPEFDLQDVPSAEDLNLPEFDMTGIPTCHEILERIEGRTQGRH